MDKCREWFLYVASFLMVFVVCGVNGLYIDGVEQSVAVRVLTEEEQQAVVDRHNYFRRIEGASNMQKMQWNQYLANMAAGWVSGCVFEHGHPPRNAKELPFRYIGQNLFASTDQSDLVSSTDIWFREKIYFNFDTNSCQEGRVCGHYTQVVWSSTTDIGCGIAHCVMSNSSSWWFYACNYGPGGNVVGDKPFEKGTACSKCSDKQKCDDGLCDK